MSAVTKLSETAPTSNEPVCPCCGSAVSPLDLLIFEFGRVIAFHGKTAHLTQKEFEAFRVLLEAYPRGLSRSEIMHRLYGAEHEWPDPKILDVLVCKIRKRILPISLDLTTEWGIGFRLSPSPEIDAARRRHLVAHRRTACDPTDLPSIRMYRKQGLPITDIARRLNMSFHAVIAGLDEIAIADRSRVA